MRIAVALELELERVEELVRMRQGSSLIRGRLWMREKRKKQGK
jgi:hypothetical protein